MLAVACLGLFVVEAAAIFDLFAFEWRPLYSIIGPQGIAVVLGVNAGAALLLALAVTRVPRKRGRPRLIAWALIVAWLLLIAWLLEWMFMETPLTLRLRPAPAAATAPAIPSAAEMPDDFAQFSVTRAIRDPASVERLGIMYERIRISDPGIFVSHPIGRTIDRYATQFDIDPVLLFHMVYVHSFWGEAASGPVPYLRAASSETIRDLVQIHLPGWFVESRIRRHLIESDLLQRIAGGAFGFKLRYALHKATLDVSAQPFELNLYSDILMLLKQYPEHFVDVLGADVTDPARMALRDSFLKIADIALQRPYEFPYSHAPLTAVQYSLHRSDFKRFSRAAYYATARDFDLAARFAALLIRYQREHYIARLGDATWQKLPPYQQAAMLAMTRDVYTPSVGRVAYNLYALPEMNCTSVEFVAQQAHADPRLMAGMITQLWRPADYSLLWGGAGTKLRVFSEVWAVAHGEPLPGLDAEDSIDLARFVLARHARE